jgi:hypothetical protein
VSQRHVAHFCLRTFGARLDCFASLAMTGGANAVHAPQKQVRRAPRGVGQLDAARHPPLLQT